jgi:hypothetical protein
VAYTSEYWKLIDTPDRDHISIFCGDSAFVPIPAKSPYAWICPKTGVSIEASTHGGDSNARMCGDAVSMAMTGRVMPRMFGDIIGDAKYLVLCDPALTSQPGVAAIKALPGDAGFYEGKPIENVALATSLSFSLVRQVMFLALPWFCQ